MGARFASVYLISRFQAELERLFHEALQLSEGEPAAGEWQPSLDIVETPESIQILVEVPGLAAGDLKVEVRGTLVIISGTKSTPLPAAQKIRFHCMERGHGRFKREVQLFWPVNSHNGAAHLADGLLTVCFPRIQDKRQAARVLHIDEGPQV